ncbi:MAG TPA: hypothetical protein VFT85_05410 [Acidimicrobiia bacterium]|nr:hypothetical protein [Acidimicrobiia bacterium]
MGALKDCEAVVHAFFGQPVNSVTALAFVLGGAVIVLRTEHTWVGIASIATGVGSFLFHGPMPPYSEWAHDLTLAWLLLVVASDGRSWERWARLPGLVVLAALVAIPGAGDVVGVVLAGLAIVSLLTRDRSLRTLGPLTLLVVVAVVGRLGATGGVLCDPDSWWQPHGLWHVGAAAAVTWWALATTGESR